MTPLPAPNFDAAAAAISDLLAAFHIDENDHTTRTPERVALAWGDILSGYRDDPAEHLAVTFSAPENPGLVVARRVRIQSTCAHHLLPITGVATIAYRPRPGQRVVGLSKLTRLADGYARRLQVQENITAQIVDAIEERLSPQWAACAITAEHGCMTLRGVRDACGDTMTYSETGEATDTDRTAFWAAHKGWGE